jgi:hypothetical protein
LKNGDNTQNEVFLGLFPLCSLDDRSAFQCQGAPAAEENGQAGPKTDSRILRPEIAEILIEKMAK